VNVEHLRRIAHQIGPTRQAAIGGTGYLDGPVHMTERAAWGTDKFGRVFITLSVRAVGRDDGGTHDSSGIVTIFQRWSGQNADVVTQANNTHGAPSIIRHAATVEDMAFIETLVLHGSASRVIEYVAGGTLHQTITLVYPDPLVEEAHQAVRTA